MKSLYIDGTMERVIATLDTLSAEFADAKIAVVQISTPTEQDLKIQDVNALLDVMRKDEGRHFDIIWGTSVKSEIPQGKATIFIVYAAD